MLFNFFKTKKIVPSNTQKILIKIDGMHCVSCSLNIDGELEDLPGVVSATTSYAKSLCEVEYDPNKITKKRILEIISLLGYKPSQLEQTI